jgi:O-antigen ligase
MVVREKQMLHHTLFALFFIGFIISMMGLFSLVLPPNQGMLWKRVLPISFAGFAPLGYNHNVIAESLVAVVPIALYLSNVGMKMFSKRFFLFSALFMTAITLLTFSRAGWIVLFLEGTLFIIWKYWKQPRKFFLSVLLSFFLFFPFLLIQYHFQQRASLRASDANRLLTWEIALDALKKHPWVGNGLGTFQNIVSENTVFRVEFGDPPDAHGIWQKLLVETGALGVVGFCIFIAIIFWLLIRSYFFIPSDGKERDLLFALLLSAMGVFVFEWFNTSYFVGKMWLPIGIALAGARILSFDDVNK